MFYWICTFAEIDGQVRLQKGAPIWYILFVYILAMFRFFLCIIYGDVSCSVETLNRIYNIWFDCLLVFVIMAGFWCVWILCDTVIVWLFDSDVVMFWFDMNQETGLSPFSCVFVDFMKHHIIDIYTVMTYIIREVSAPLSRTSYYYILPSLKLNNSFTNTRNRPSIIKGLFCPRNRMRT